MSTRMKTVVAYLIVVLFVLIGMLGSIALGPSYAPVFRAAFAMIGTYLAYKLSSSLSASAVLLVVLCLTFVLPLAVLQQIGRAYGMSPASRFGLLDFVWLAVPALATIILALLLKRASRNSQGFRQ